MRTIQWILAATFAASPVLAEDPPGSRGPSSPRGDGSAQVRQKDARPGDSAAARDERRGPGGRHDGDESGARGAHGERSPGHFRGMGAELRKKFREGKPNAAELKKSIEQWRAARDDRRRERQQALAARWGTALGQPNVANELTVHARRMAHLQRMEEVVAVEKTGAARQKLLDRVEKLRELENQRHERALSRLASRDAAAGPSATPGASGAAPAAAGSAR